MHSRSDCDTTGHWNFFTHLLYCLIVSWLLNSIVSINNIVLMCPSFSTLCSLVLYFPVLQFSVVRSSRTSYQHCSSSEVSALSLSASNVERQNGRLTSSWTPTWKVTWTPQPARDTSTTRGKPWHARSGRTVHGPYPRWWSGRHDPPARRGRWQSTGTRRVSADGTIRRNAFIMSIAIGVNDKTASSQVLVVYNQCRTNIIHRRTLDSLDEHNCSGLMRILSQCNPLVLIIIISSQRILTKSRIACRAVIHDWTIPFAAYTAAETPMLFTGPDNLQKLPLPVGV